MDDIDIDFDRTHFPPSSLHLWSHSPAVLPYILLSACPFSLSLGPQEPRKSNSYYKRKEMPFYEGRRDKARARYTTPDDSDQPKLLLLDIHASKGKDAGRHRCFVNSLSRRKTNTIKENKARKTRRKSERVEGMRPKYRTMNDIGDVQGVGGINLIPQSTPINIFQHT